MKPKRISEKQLGYASVAYAAGLFILSLLGLFEFVNFDNEIVAVLYGVMLGVTIARVIHGLFSPDSKETEQEQEVTINRLFDEEPDDETLSEAINVMREELRKRGVLP